MKTLIGYGRRPKNLQSDADLEMKLKTLLQSLSFENSKVSLNHKALLNILSTIQGHLELTKGYLAALTGTSQWVSSHPLMSPLDAKEMMAQHSVILSESLETTWNAIDALNKFESHLREPNSKQGSGT